jgi:alpha-mannosidase
MLYFAQFAKEDAMTIRDHDPRFEQHPHMHYHAHEHLPSHTPDHTHAHEPLPSQRGLSRRGFLFTAAATATGLLLARFERVAGRSLFPANSAQKRIYIAPDDHTDYMWTADEATYQSVFLEMLDYYLDRADSTAANASPYQSRWNCDGTLWVWVYERNRSASGFQRLINRIRDGHVSVPLNPLCTVLGGAPAEAVLRGMYYPGHLERRYNLRFTLAYAMENQTLPYGLGALWAGSGAKYSWKGICGCASQVPDPENREHEIYWWVGPDGSKILMKWHSMLGDSRGIGGYAEAYDPGAAVEYVSTTSFFQRFGYNVIGAFGKGWDGLKTLTQEFVTIAQSKTNAGRQVIVSNEYDFFEDFEATYDTTNLPSLSCTFGNEWELCVASLAELSARVKRAVEKLRGAEALATLVSLKQPAFMTGREAARDLAFLDLGLYWEHCWPADSQAVTQNQRLAWVRKLVNEIESYVNPLHSDAATALGGMIQNSGSYTRFFVFNSLSWARTDIADYAYSGPAGARVFDVSTWREVPAQRVTIDGQAYLRILASNVPSAGYKVFEIRPAGQAAQLDNAIPSRQAAQINGPVFLPQIDNQFGGTPSVSGNVIENEFYRITLAANGAITGLWDKTRQREFARTIGGYAINDLGASTGTLTVENAGPVSATLKATASSPVAHTSRITLIRGSKRIDVRNNITENFSNLLTWRFGFNLSAPDVWHEEVGAIIRARYTTDGGHYYYNSQHLNARYDWLTLNRFADMSGGGVGVTLANADCYYMRLGNSRMPTGSQPVFDTTTPQISVLAGGKVDWEFYHTYNLGFADQGGDSNFLQRFALQTHGAYDQAAAMRFAMEAQNPLITGTITGGSAYPPGQFSLLSISNSNVLLSALKPADDGISTGIVARVWNLSNAPAGCSLSLPGNSLASARQLTHIETPLAQLTVAGGVLNDSLAAQQLKTYSLVPQSLLTMSGSRANLPAGKK